MAVERISESDWKRDCKQLIFCLSLLLATIGVVALLSYLISMNTEYSVIDAFMTVVEFSFYPTLVYVLISDFKEKKRAGTALADCGPHQEKIGCLFLAILFLVFGLTSTINSFNNSEESFRVSFILYLSLFFFKLGLSRFQIRENGIWDHGSLWNWNLIHSAHWDEEARSTLYFQYENSSFSSLKEKYSMRIPQKNKPIVEELLQKHGCSGGET